MSQDNTGAHGERDPNEQGAPPSPDPYQQPPAQPSPDPDRQGAAPPPGPHQQGSPPPHQPPQAPYAPGGQSMPPYQSPQYQSTYPSQPYESQPYESQPYESQPYPSQPYQAQPYQAQQTPFQPTPYGAGAYGQRPSAGTDGFSIAALVTGVLGMAVVPIVLGVIGLSRIKRTGQQGKGLAIAGIVLGGIAVVGWTIFAILAVTLVQSGVIQDIQDDIRNDPRFDNSIQEYGDAAHLGLLDSPSDVSPSDVLLSTLH